MTSASLSEGKTNTAANLAAVFAQAGTRVILADCDLRRPRVHEFFGLPNRVGFTSVLLGEVAVTAATNRLADARQLLVMPSGPRPPNPSELLSSLRAQNLLTTLKESADIVIIDSPPLLPVTDASVLAARVDGVLLVVMAGTTTRRPLQRAVELLRQTQVPVIGAVLTNASGESGYGYGYEGYETLDDESSRRLGRQRGSRHGRQAAPRRDEGERVVS